MSDLKPGLYDLLLTRRVRERLVRLHGAQADVDAIDDANAPDYLTRYIAREIRAALRAVPKEDRQMRQIELVNKLAELVQTSEDEADVDVIDPPAEVLKAIYAGPQRPESPTTALSATNLLMNAVGEPKLGFELERELATSDSVLMLVSFLQWRGWQRLKEGFEKLAERGAPVRILTTTYIGATDLRALQELSRLSNVELRISLDGRRRRLHAKAWLFQRDNGFSTVYIGSANLSAPALEDGIEWTVKLSEVEAPHIVERFRGAFESLWCDEEFEPFRSDDSEMCHRVAAALAYAKGKQDSAGVLSFFDLRPHPYQQVTLDRLESERVDRGSFRNLVVAPTGTGKTVTAAFDYKRQPFTGRRPRLLYLAHREELLIQARNRFRHVLRDESFGDLLGGGMEPSSFDHLFATIQSFGRRGLLDQLGPAYWHYAVLDEAHHVPADSYRDIIASLAPQILLGLTATPERMDGASILPWFDNRIADEMRLWHAIERQYLVPFDYYGVHDGTDLSELSWSRGSYVVSELERQYVGNRRRAAVVAHEFVEKHPDWKQARALGFCVSIAHANYMAECFNAAGIRARAITSESPAEERSRAGTMLRKREVNVLFTVDLFNEGVDIPEVDCVLFLRPTESSTVFLQQLGRGLRLHDEKQLCLVLDFIGNQRREFRFDQRLMALLGGTRKQLEEELETGITRLPGNCYFRLDKESRQIILRNLRTQLRSTRANLVIELKNVAGQLQRRPSLTEFLASTRYELEDLYKPSVGGWHALLSEAQLTTALRTPEDSALVSRFDMLLHIDAVRRLQFYSALLRGGSFQHLSPLEQRTVQMLTFRLLQAEARRPECPWSTSIERLRANESARLEMEELLQAMLDQVRFHSDEKPALADCPIYLHRRYTRDEVLVGLGLADQVGRFRSQTGCFWAPEMNTEIFFVTLDKSEKSFSPTTRYEDFAVSPTRFHWQSQSTTSEGSVTGRRYTHQRETGVKFFLFVRSRRGEPFIFLGPLRYVSHTGTRPMSIYWDLEYPMPAWFFEICASLRAA